MENNKDAKYAGFWVRVLAFLIDGLILSIPMKILESVIGLEEWLGIIVSLFLLWAYYGYLVYRWRATIGKRVLGLEILNYDLTPITLQKASLRVLYSLLTYTIAFAPLSMFIVLAFVYGPLIYIFYLLLLLPILMILMTNKKQVLHDYFAKTIVVDVKYMLKNDSIIDGQREVRDENLIKKLKDVTVSKEKKKLKSIKVIITIAIVSIIGYGLYYAYVMATTMFVLGSYAKYKSQEFHEKLEKYQSIDEHNDSRISFYVEEFEKSSEKYFYADTVPQRFKARVKRKLALNCIGYFLKEHNDPTWLDQVQAVDRNQLSTYEQNNTIYNKRKSDENWNFYEHYYFNEIYDAQDKVASSFDKETSQRSCDKLHTTDEMFNRFLPIYINKKEETLSSDMEQEKHASYFGTLNKSFYQRSIKETKKLLKILNKGFPNTKKYIDIKIDKQLKEMKEYQKITIQRKAREKKKLAQERAILKEKREKKIKQEKIINQRKRLYKSDIKRGVPPVFSAIQNHLYNKLSSIIKEGVDIELKNKFGDSPLKFALYQRDDKLVKILLESGANPNIINGGYNPLTSLLSTNRVSTVKLLLEYGVDVNYQYKKSETALTEAAKGCKNFDMVKLLLDKGADPKLMDRNRQNTLTGLKRYCYDEVAYEKMKKFIERNTL